MNGQPEIDRKSVEMALEATAVKARSNAAIALAVHARIAPLEAPPTVIEAPAPSRLVPQSTRRRALLVIQAALLGAAIAAPWILLLTS
jgi:hypothetical protein